MVRILFIQKDHPNVCYRKIIPLPYGLVRSQWTSDYDPTIEDSYSVTRSIDGLSYHLSLTDTAGQEEYRSLWAASNLQSDAFLLVYDITNAHSLEGLTWFLEMIDIESDNRMEENARLLREKGSKVRGNRDAGWRIPPIKIIAGNKCDLKEARIVSSKMGLDWAKSKDCGFMETSARDMVNIEETFACKLSVSSISDHLLTHVHRDGTPRS